MLDKRYQCIIFIRYPEPGKTKTRLIPALGPEKAALLSRRLGEHVLDQARAACKKSALLLSIGYTGSNLGDFRCWLGPDLRFSQQSSGDIGERMKESFKKALAQDVPGALLVGSDLPGLTSDILQQATTAITHHDVVLGPAADGGYYLIGMKRYHPELFAGIDWATKRVADQTRAQAASLNLSIAEIPMLDDIDRPGDLDMLRNNPRFHDIFTDKPRLSIIIPTLNEAAVLGPTLERAQQDTAVEIIVADEGSTDTTGNIARQAGAVVINAKGGRSAQLNAGAAAATGSRLLFLHADTLLPKNYKEIINRTLDDPATVAGAFRFQTDISSLAIKMVSWGTNIRSSLFSVPYGDQGLFIEKRIFDEIGGFADLPIMEDFELVQRLRRRGRIVTTPEAIITSARRWKHLGILRTMLRNQAVIIGYYAGINPKRLARFYRTK